MLLKGNLLVNITSIIVINNRYVKAFQVQDEGNVFQNNSFYKMSSNYSNF